MHDVDDSSSTPLSSVFNLYGNPRRPEHCVTIADVEFPQKHGFIFSPVVHFIIPFFSLPSHSFTLHADSRYADGNNPEEQAAKYNIEGVDETLTVGILNNIIPAIASTTSSIAAMCVKESLTFSHHTLSLT